MWTLTILLLFRTAAADINKSEEPTVYYYGLEESERGLPQCVARQACSALLERYWRPAAVVRLCRCGRRQRCPDTKMLDHRAIELNNRAQFKFCQSVTDWPQCSYNEVSLIVNTTYERLDPDELEELHHQNMHLIPPKVTFKCRCKYPNYWQLNSTSQDDAIHRFQCRMLPVCNTGAFCGNFRYDLHSLYQSCLCPRQHICVHNGGVTYTNIAELLYRGKGRKAYCQRIGDADNYSYEEYQQEIDEQ